MSLNHRTGLLALAAVLLACKPAPTISTIPPPPVATPIPPPPPDRDADGIPDASDRCPDEPEDPDHFADADGCVDRDNDGDGILDAHEFVAGRWTNCDYKYEHGGDRDCRDAPEDLDGCADHDGCPDVFCFTCGNFTLPGRLHFDRRGQLAGDSERILDEIAATIHASPGLRFFVDSHTDAQASDAAAQRLTRQVAAAVVDALVARRVARERLEPRAIGDAKPTADNRSAAGRAANRRVEFTPILLDGCCEQPLLFNAERSPDPDRPQPGECR